MQNKLDSLIREVTAYNKASKNLENRAYTTAWAILRSPRLPENVEQELRKEYAL